MSLLVVGTAPIFLKKNLSHISVINVVKTQRRCSFCGILDE